MAVLALLLTATLVGIEPPAEEAAPPTVRERRASDPEQRWRIAGGWMAIAPVGVGIPGQGDANRVHRQAVSAGYRWGVSAGATFQPGRRLWLNLAGNFEQSVWIFRNLDGYELCFAGDCYGWTERGLGHLMRIGPDVRVGVATRWLLAWARAGGHVGVSVIRLDCDESTQDHCDRREIDVGPGAGAGLGLAVRITPRSAMGIEGGLQYTWLESRDDPFSVVKVWDVGMIATLRF